MSVRGNVARYVSAFAWRIHDGVVKRVISTTGIRPLLRRGYWFVLFSLVTPDPKQKSLEGFNPPLAELPVYVGLMTSLRPDDVVWDVGAHHGQYTASVANALPSDRIVAFEPFPENVARLRDRLVRNDLDATIVERALSDYEGTAELGLGPISAAHRLVDEVADPEEDAAVEVAVTTGDAVIEERGLPAPTVVKIDAEGAGVAVLRGMEGALRGEECRLVYCEVHPELLADRGESPAALEAVLVDYGFDVE